MKINVDLIYPVGSIYFTTNTIDPSILFGGAWERYATGRCIVGWQSGDNDFGTVGNTGGAKTHTLTKAQLPNETLKVIDPTYGWEVGTAGYNTGSGSAYPGISALRKEPTNSQLLRTSAMGSGQAHNNLQPYIVTYVWRRIA